MQSSQSSEITRILIDEETIRQRVGTLAAQIAADYADADTPLYLVGVLKGAFIFLADLARRLARPHAVDFMSVSSYGRSATSGEVRLVMDLRQPIEGRHVILVEDIVDTGQTLAYLTKTLASRGPASLRTCAFVRKERPGVHTPDYLGFTIPDVWVVGYGLDYADRYRTLPYIAELAPHVYQSSD
ncbi:MAG: hypoxanthine phosphoribosyltransferase [Anaerolineales bacterium]|nr:hypoxanthine phosphoribosyltransferase [Anaerolineales bacterium]